MERRNLFVFFLCVYSALLFSLDALPFLDFPNHVTRSCIMGSLYTDVYSPFHVLFTFNPQFVPYIFADLLMGATCTVLDPMLTGRIWIVVGFLVVPLGMAYWMKQLELNKVVAGLILLVSIYLSTNWFFFSGFYSYQLGFGLALFALGMHEKWARTKGVSAYIVYGLLCTSVYLTHLAPFVCIGIMLGLGGLIGLWQKRMSLVQVALGYFPLALMCVMYVVNKPLSEGRRSELVFRSVINKLTALGTPFVRFSFIGDALLFCAIMAVILAAVFPLRNQIVSACKRGRASEFAMVAAALFATYLVLPVGGLNLYDIDNRVLPFALIAALLALGIGASHAELTPKLARSSQVALSLLLVLNAGAILYVLVPQNRETREYIDLLRKLPERRTVLTIATRPDVGRVQPLVHTGSLYTMFQRGMTPYIFRGDMFDSMTYFRFRGELYRPDIFWYVRHYDPLPWDKIHANYPIIVVTKPVDQSRLDLTGYTLLVENGVAAAYQRDSRPDETLGDAAG